MLNSIIKLLIKLVIVLAVVGGACLFVWNKTRQHYEENPIILDNVTTETVQGPVEFIEKEIQISSATINEGLREIGVLNTAEYYFTHIGKYSETEQLFGYDIPFTESSYIYSYDGTICAGLDFSAVLVDVDQDTRTITLTLPKVEITSFEIDTDSFQLYDESISLVNRLSVGSVADSISSMEEEERQKAIDKGILEKAEENAELLVKNFMNGLYEANGYSLVINHSA